MLAVRFQTRNATGFHSIPCQFGCAWWFSQKQWKEKHSSPYSPENHHYLMISRQKLPQEAGQIPALRRTKLRSFGGAMPRPQRRRKLIEHGEECEAQGTHHHINIQTYRRIINRYWNSHYNIYIYIYVITHIYVYDYICIWLYMCVRIIIHVLGICIDNHRYMRTYTLALVLPLPGRSSHDLFQPWLGWLCVRFHSAQKKA